MSSLSSFGLTGYWGGFAARKLREESERASILDAVYTCVEQEEGAAYLVPRGRVGKQT